YSTQWWQEICAAIDGAQNVVFVISPDSLTSEYCHRELARARAGNKRIITVLRRAVDGRAVNDALFDQPWEAEARENWRHVDATQYLPIRETDDFDAAVASLLRTLNTDHELVRMHTRIGTRAGEWQAAPDESLLLRGQDLQLAQQWLAGNPSPAPTEIQRAYITASQNYENQVLGQRRTLTLRQFLGLRYLGAAVGSGFSIGVAVFVLRDDPLGTLAALRLLSALALGALFGCLLGLAILVATELELSLPHLGKLSAWAAGGFVCALAFGLYHALQRGSLPDDVPVWLGSALAFTAGFWLAERLSNTAVRACIAAAGVFAALYLPQIIAAPGIFQFGTLALPLSAGSAILIGILTFLPEFNGLTHPSMMAKHEARE
ncbi:MAG: toll/interleukin-1 receptor domain-containing protein, partial [Anaerolineae bacterium]|nr:toll/interleukin-1 receptor domain-containing protein [Anaerolineae bacterium]